LPRSHAAFGFGQIQIGVRDSQVQVWRGRMVRNGESANRMNLICGRLSEIFDSNNSLGDTVAFLYMFQEATVSGGGNDRR
jgi:hypothetical protein